jgi:hypothetical protein
MSRSPPIRAPTMLAAPVSKNCPEFGANKVQVAGAALATAPVADLPVHQQAVPATGEARYVRSAA